MHQSVIRFNQAQSLISSFLPPACSQMEKFRGRTHHITDQLGTTVSWPQGMTPPKKTLKILHFLAEQAAYDTSKVTILLEESLQRMLKILCYGRERRFRKCHPSAYAALCTHGTCRQSQWRLRCPGVILEGTGVPGPQRCLNQTLSKGREAFAHRLPRGRVAPNPMPSERETLKRWDSTGT